MHVIYIPIFKLQIPPSHTIQDNSADWANVSMYRAGKGDPDDNIPLGSVQYFIAGSFVQSEIAYALPLTLFSSSAKYRTIIFNRENLLFDLILSRPSALP